MAYVTGDLNIAASPGTLKSDRNIWTYSNTAGDTEATIKGAGFISDGFNKGMKQGDIVYCFNLSGVAANSAILANATLATKAAPACTLGASVVVT